MLQLPKLATPVRLRSPAPFFSFKRESQAVKFSFFRFLSFLPLAGVILFCGCVTEKLPSEDIEIFTKHKAIIDVLKSNRFSANSKEKYEAAKQLIKLVDFSYTRELKTVNEIFNYRDMLVDNQRRDNPVYTFNYRYGDNYVRIRFFSHRMFVVRTEVTEK